MKNVVSSFPITSGRFPLDQGCVLPSDLGHGGFSPVAYQGNVNHKVTFSPFYKPHPFLSKGVDARKINLWTFFAEIYCLIANLVNLLNIRNIWLTTERHQENLFSYSKLCQTEAPSVQFPQCLYINFSWKLFEVCFLSGYDHLEKPITWIPVCMCMQVHTYRFGLHWR